MIAIGEHQRFHGKTKNEIELAEAVLAFEHVCDDAWDLAIQKAQVYGNWVYFNSQRFRTIRDEEGIAIDLIEDMDEGYTLGDERVETIYGYDDWDEYDQTDDDDEPVWTLDDDGEAVI